MKLQLLTTFWLRIQKFFKIFIVQQIRLLLVPYYIEHVYGPISVDYSIDELIVLCLVRNGELHIKSFIEHYFSLGVKHIVFLDNGSTDNTVSIAVNYPNVTVLRTTLLFKRNKLAMRLYLIKRFATEKWSLYVDIDELFDYPFSNVLNLTAFIHYLNQKSYTAVVAHLLDMFRDESLLSRKSKPDDSLKEIYRYYDISDITKWGYYFPRNTISNNSIKVYFGGIRKTLFVSDSRNVADYDILTKHPLFLLKDNVRPLFIDEHGIRNAHVADFSCVLFHYKFLSDFYERTIQIVKEESYFDNSVHYKKYLKVLKNNPNFQIKQDTAQKLSNVNSLIDNKFLVVSDDYIDWVQKHQ